MIKEISPNVLELDDYVKNDFLSKRDFIERRSKSASLRQLFVKKRKSPKPAAHNFTQLEKTRIVLSGLTGDADVAEICLQENIDEKTFFQWKKDFLQAFERFSTEPVSSQDGLNNVFDKEVLRFFRDHLQNLDPAKNLILAENENLSSNSSFYNIENVFVLNKINNFRKINKRIEEINERMPMDGLLFGSFETYKSIYNRSRYSSIPVVKQLYFAFQFAVHRAAPKLKFFKKAYFQITKGRNRLLSKAEALGRLVSCGFEIIDYKDINGIHYFVAKKVKAPYYDMNPSYGPLFKMQRVGKNGKIIGVYKLRTMHPYSEYLQDFILKRNGYSQTGKPANDFRLVPWGKVLRRYWMDELPQLINVLKGEMKLVGIRPVSQRYFDDIPEEIQKLRLTQKPGCIPPYVALNRMSSVDSVIEAEKEYLLEKIRNPYFTDTKYFFKAVFNIVFKNKRSA